MLHWSNRVTVPPSSISYCRDKVPLHSFVEPSRTLLTIPSQNHLCSLTEDTGTVTIPVSQPCGPLS